MRDQAGKWSRLTVATHESDSERGGTKLYAEVRARRNGGADIEGDSVRGIPREIGVRDCHTGKSIERREANVLAENDVVEDGSESEYAELVGADIPSERRVEEEICRERGKLALVVNGEGTRRLKIRYTATSGAANGRQRDICDIVALVINLERLGELRKGQASDQPRPSQTTLKVDSPRSMHRRL